MPADTWLQVMHTQYKAATHLGLVTRTGPAIKVTTHRCQQTATGLFDSSHRHTGCTMALTVLTLIALLIWYTGRQNGPPTSS